MQQPVWLVNKVSTRYYRDVSDQKRQAHDLVERLCNLVRADIRAVCSEYGMRPVQLQALEFLTRCNRYSDTPQAVAEFLGLTKGTVSQTLKVLEHKGMVRKQADGTDRRLVHLKPTAEGRRLVARALPSALLGSGLDRMSTSDASATVRSMRALLRSVQQANELNTFAPCKTCRFNQTREHGYFCTLTQEPLTEQDIELLCREHQFGHG